MRRTPPTRIALATIALLGATSHLAARAGEAAPPVAHRTVSVDGLSIFYREAGPPDAPAVLLPHGLLLDAGHFALETHAGDIVAAMLEFLAHAPSR